MVRYMKCPRCELNYIDAEKQEYCDVCLKEMKGLPMDIDEIEESENDMPTELCPVCGENMMRVGDKMCEECRKKSEYESEEPNPDDEDDDEWREYLDDDNDSDIDAELGESFEGEFDEEIEEEEEEEFVEEEEEDLEYVTGDEIYTIGDDEDDEEEDGDDDF